MKTLILLITIGFVKAQSGCQAGWTPFGDSCYLWVSGLHTDYATAEHVCKTANGKMLTVDTKAEENFVASHYSHIEDHIWFDAANSHYDNWNVTSRKERQEEKCGAIRFQSREKSVWIHADCDYHYDVVCKAASKSERDSFCDLVKEIDTKYSCFGAPTTAPSTVPTTWTTAMPSFAPTSPSCEPGWSRFGRHCYRMFCTARTQNEAQDHCLHMGANLASIHSAEENEFLVELSRDCSDFRVWLGAKVVQLNPTRLFWFDGSEHDYDNFKGKKTSDWRFDSIELSDAANWEFQSNNDAFVGYVCKKAL